MKDKLQSVHNQLKNKSRFLEHHGNGKTWYMGVITLLDLYLKANMPLFSDLFHI